MKNPLLILLAVLAIFGASCNKVDSTERCARVNIIATDSETVALKAYLSANSISAAADARGFFYVINRVGTDSTHPTICSKVTASYTGRLTNGTQFDAQSGAVFNLSNVILGWQEGVPLITKGGSITLYLPPSLAYGSIATSGIPANSVLVFQIDLLKVE